MDLVLSILDQIFQNDVYVKISSRQLEIHLGNSEQETGLQT